MIDPMRIKGLYVAGFLFLAFSSAAPAATSLDGLRDWLGKPRQGRRKLAGGTRPKAAPPPDHVE